jgi:hypothetical protein
MKDRSGREAGQATVEYVRMLVTAVFLFSVVAGTLRPVLDGAQKRLVEALDERLFGRGIYNFKLGR